MPPLYRQPFLSRKEVIDLINEAKSMINLATEEADKLRKEIGALENVAPSKIFQMLSRVDKMEEAGHAILRSLLKAVGVEATQKTEPAPRVH